MVRELLNFLDKSCTSYHATYEIEKELQACGFVECAESSKWNLKKGGKYYVKRNDSSIIAFNIGERLSNLSFNLVSSHSDAPALKLKPKVMISKDNSSQLNVEVYGGPLFSTWFDRPLSVAGKVMVKENGKIVSRLVNINEPCAIIPNVAIHLNREANSGYKYNAQTDLLPFVSMDKNFSFMDYLAEKEKVNVNDIIDSELYLYPFQKGCIWGSDKEFISAYHIDDLMCAFTTFKGFLKGSHQDSINVYCMFDNEEIGSSTRQGAFSTFLCDVLNRIKFSLKIDEESFMQALSQSLMISADNAHAYHPNHPEKLDPTNICYMNKGVVIKYSANKKYATDAVSSSLFKELCKNAKVDYQEVTNRSDMAGGSTLGPISTRTLSIPT
ncbi:MAG: M18 family aminopeptidase, partial [Anaerorhabdus sp.]